MISHKKGNVVMSSILFIIVIVVASLMSLFGWKIWTDIAPEIRADTNMTEADDLLNEVEDRYPAVMDGIIMMIFLGLWIFGIAAAFFNESHPFLFGLMFILIIFVIIAGVILGNFYEELFQDEDLNTIGAEFPKTHWILTHMLLIGIVISISMALTYFGVHR